jgi:Leucine-rich repeat (LRR) protein
MNINSSESAVIGEVSGQHFEGQTDQNVMGFLAENNKIQFFPRNLHEIFKNLELILIMRSQLKEIHQKDLKHFPNLEFLCLDFNEIEVIDANLFASNPNLIFISLSFNKIQHVGPESFHKLKKLNYLLMNSNSCIDMYAENDLIEVKHVIKHTKLKCSKNNNFWIVFVIVFICVIFVIFTALFAIFCSYE